MRSSSILFFASSFSSYLLLAVYQLVTSVSLCRDQPSSLSAGSFPQFTTRNPSYIIHLTPEVVLAKNFQQKLELAFFLKFYLLAGAPDWKLFMTFST